MLSGATRKDVTAYAASAYLDVLTTKPDNEAAPPGNKDETFIQPLQEEGYFFLRELALLLGTLAPERRASERPIAIACFLLFTLRPERPLRSVPRFRSCIARLTLLCAFLP
jgi:hypothetical protein